MNHARITLALAGLVLLAGCGSSGSSGASSSGGSSPTPASPAPSAIASPTPSGPPTATVSTTGDADVAGTATVSIVTCSSPDVSGTGIIVNGPIAGSSAGARVSLTIQANLVTVYAIEASAGNHFSRVFKGTGVTNFDAAKGASVSGSVTEDKALSGNPGKVGAIKSITVTVNCANQQPGDSTINVTGTTAGGAINGPLTAARVTCGGTGQAQQMSITALLTVGTKQVQATVVLGADGSATVSADGHFYSVAKSASTLTATAGDVSGDVTESGTNVKLHLAGHADCGSSTAT